MKTHTLHPLSLLLPATTLALAAGVALAHMGAETHDDQFLFRSVCSSPPLVPRCSAGADSHLSRAGRSGRQPVSPRVPRVVAVRPQPRGDGRCVSLLPSSSQSPVRPIRSLLTLAAHRADPSTMTTGPYYIPDTALRSNITEDRAGVPLTLDIQVVDVETCLPLACYVDLWVRRRPCLLSSCLSSPARRKLILARLPTAARRPTPQATTRASWTT